jgi:DNA-binding NarL/FixJ family response regulator
VPIRVILADDHAVVLKGLQRLFDGEEDFAVVECCHDGDQALQAVRTQAADVLVLDVRMPGRTGLDVLRELGKDARACHTVLLAAVISEEETVEAVQLGARGIVLKAADPDALLDCVRRVHQGERLIDEETLRRAVSMIASRNGATRGSNRVLTPRETEIVRMVAQGLRNRVIGERLTIAEGTVKIHLHNIYEKVKVNGRLELVLWAQERGLV